MKKVLKYIGIVGIFALGSLFFVRHMAQADPSDNISGWGWNDTIGWVSFNCTDPGLCASSSYGVTATPSGSNYVLSGYAWNDSLGWISFNAADVAGCPGGSCTPTINTSTNFGAVTGFARILSLGAGAGYIQLSDTSTFTSPTTDGSGGVTYVNWTHSLVGSAWSSDVGWIRFGTSYGDVLAGISPSVGAGAVDFSVNNWHYVDNLSPNFVQLHLAQASWGNTSYVKWGTQNVMDCVAASQTSDPNWTGTIPNQTTPAVGRALSQNGPPVSSKWYTITCTDIGTGAPISKTITLSYNQDAMTSVRHDNKVLTSTGFNYPVHVNWWEPSFVNDCQVSTTSGTSIATATPVTTSPVMSGGPVLPNGNLDPNPDGSATHFLITFPGPLPTNTTYYFVTINCDDGSGTGTRVSHTSSYRNWVTPATPLSVNVSANVTTANPGDPINLTYTASGADYCDAYSSPVNGAWDSTFFSFSSGNTNGVVPTTMGTATTTFYFACHGIDGTTQTASDVVTLIPPVVTAPSVSLDPLPTSVNANEDLAGGGQTLLTYSSSNVVSCTTTPSSTPSTNPDWDGIALTPNATVSVPVDMLPDTTIFHIHCIGIAPGTVADATAVVSVTKTLELELVSWNPAPSTYIHETLRWKSSIPLPGPCEASQTSSSSGWNTYTNGIWDPANATTSWQTQTDVRLTSDPTVYHLRCKDSSGNWVDSNDVSAGIVIPYIDLKVDGIDGPVVPVIPGTQHTLTWTSSSPYVDHCFWNQLPTPSAIVPADSDDIAANYASGPNNPAVGIEPAVPPEFRTPTVFPADYYITCLMNQGGMGTDPMNPALYFTDYVRLTALPSAPITPTITIPNACSDGTSDAYIAQIVDDPSNVIDPASCYADIDGTSNAQAWRIPPASDTLANYIPYTPPGTVSFIVHCDPTAAAVAAGYTGGTIYSNANNPSQINESGTAPFCVGTEGTGGRGPINIQER